MEKKITQKTCFIFTIIFFSLAIGAINYFTPYLADDYSYVKTAKTFSSLKDIVDSTRSFYMNWGGRINGHILTNLFCMLKPFAFDLLNTLCYMTVTWIIYLICKGSKKHNLSLYIGIHALLWICVPDYGQVMFWLCGSANYLWCSLPIVLLLYLHQNYIVKKGNYMNRFIYSFPLFIIGFIAGISMENMSAGMIVIITLQLLYFRKNIGKINIPVISSYVGSLLGFACLIFAPGNQARAAAETNINLSIPFKFFIISYYWVTFVGIICIIWLVLYLIKRYLHMEVVTIPYVIGAIASAYCMLAAPSSPERTWYIVCVYLIIAVGILYNSLEIEKSSLHKAIITVVCAGTMIFLGAAMSDTILYSREIYTQTMAREEYILDQKEKGNLDITTKVITHKYPFRAKHDGLTGLSDITDDSGYWINQKLAEYYGVNSIVGIQ